MTVGGLASNGVAFTVTVAPTITSLNPTERPGRTSVTITGTNFGATKGSSTVTFNGTRRRRRSGPRRASSCRYPTGATSGKVVVTVGGLASNGVTFVVTVLTGGVTVDAVGPGATGAAVSGGSALSWTHTISATGSNRLLTVAVAVGKDPDAGLSLTATYNGVAMTSAGLVHSNNRNTGFVQMFYLKAPASGAHTVQVTVSGGTADLEGGSVSFIGVDQATPVRNVTTTFGSGTAPTVAVSSAPGDVVVDALVTGCNGGITSTQTVRWLRQANCNSGGGNGAQSTAAGAASVTMRYTGALRLVGLARHGHRHGGEPCRRQASAR